MKFTGISNSYIYVTMFLCSELCYCILIDRAMQDKIDLLKGTTCDKLNSQLQNGRCTCPTEDETTTVASLKDNNEIKCLESGAFHGGTKYISAITFNIISIFLNKLTYKICHYRSRMYITFIYSNIVDYVGCIWKG